MCYFHLLYTTVFLLCFTQIPPHPNILSGFHVFYNLNNGNESVLKSSLCKFLAFLFSPLYPFVLKKTPLWYCYLLYVYITDLYICYFSHLRGMLSEYSCVIWQWVIKKKKKGERRKKKALLFYSPQFRWIQRHMEGIQDESESSTVVQNSSLCYSWEAAFSIMWIYFLLTGTPK